VCFKASILLLLLCCDKLCDIIFLPFCFALQNSKNIKFKLNGNFSFRVVLPAPSGFGPLETRESFSSSFQESVVDGGWQ